MFALLDCAFVKRWARRGGFVAVGVATWWMEPAAFRSVWGELTAGRWQNPALWLLLTIVAGVMVGRLFNAILGVAYSPTRLVGPLILMLGASWWTQNDPQRWHVVKSVLRQQWSEANAAYLQWRDGWIRDDAPPVWAGRHWWEQADD